MHIITFSTNVRYQSYALSLTKSIRNFYDGIILCRCVNCEESFIEQLKSYDVTVLIDNQLLSKKKRPKHPNDIPLILPDGTYNKNFLCTDEIAYTCHSRFLNIQHAFEHYDQCTVLAIDCDFIMRKDFSSIFDIGNNDICMMDKEECKHEDAIIMQKSEKSIKFLSDLIDQLNNDKYFWDQDTIALLYAFENNDVKFKELELHYKDYTLSDDSCIWSGDGVSKYSIKFSEALK